MNAVHQLLTDHLDIWTAADTERKSGRGRSSGNAASVYGIKKLRELILELAVRGKLVQQDPNDEPASELLKRIQAEKAKLTAEGKIKKDKPLPPITDDEKEFALPQGWEWVKFPDVYFFQEGPGIRNWQFRSEGIKLLNVQNIVKGDLILANSDKHISTEEYTEKYLHFTIEEGDLLFASSGGSWGKTAFFSDPGFKVIVNTSTVRMHPYFKVCSRFYMRAFVDSLSFTNQMLAQLVGMQPNFGSTHLSKIVLALPPLAEQHRIVAKVDELMALCDQLETQHSNAAEAREKLVSHLLGTLTQSQSAEDFSVNWQRIATHFDILFTTEASIDALKQTLLQLAVMGKLVPQDPNDESASELLKRIQAEKAKLIAEGKIKKDKPLPSITEDEKPFDLPEGWEWVKCQDICYKITDGEHATPRRSESGYYLLSARNVTNDGIILDDVDYVPLDEFERIRSRCDPNIGDILISCSGSVGRVALVDKDNTYSMVRSAAMIRPNQNWLYKQYIAFLLRSVYLQNQMKNRSKQSAQANLFLGAISNLVFIIPPLAEQHRIVAKIDELMAICDQLKSRITEANQLQQKLADVVVEQALN